MSDSIKVIYDFTSDYCDKIYSPNLTALKCHKRQVDIFHNFLITFELLNIFECQFKDSSYKPLPLIKKSSKKFVLVQ